MKFVEIVVQIPFSYIISVVGGVVTAVIAMAGVIGVLWKADQKSKNQIVELSKSFVKEMEKSNQLLADHNRVTEDTLKVIKDLPETIMLHIKANRHGGGN